MVFEGVVEMSEKYKSTKNSFLCSWNRQAAVEYFKVPIFDYSYTHIGPLAVGFNQEKFQTVRHIDVKKNIGKVYNFLDKQIVRKERC